MGIPKRYISDTSPQSWTLATACEKALSIAGSWTSFIFALPCETSYPSLCTLYSRLFEYQAITLCRALFDSFCSTSQSSKTWTTLLSYSQLPFLSGNASITNRIDRPSYLRGRIQLSWPGGSLSGCKALKTPAQRKLFSTIRSHLSESSSLHLTLKEDPNLARYVKKIGLDFSKTTPWSVQATRDLAQRVNGCWAFCPNLHDVDIYCPKNGLNIEEEADLRDLVNSWNRRERFVFPSVNSLRLFAPTVYFEALEAAGMSLIWLRLFPRVTELSLASESSQNSLIIIAEISASV